MHPANKNNFGAAVGKIAVQFNNGNSVVAGHIVKQTGTHKYVVTADGVTTYAVELAQTDTTPAAGEMTILVYPYVNGAVSNTPEHVRNLTNNLVYTIEGNKYAWTFGAAVAVGQCNIAQIVALPAAPVASAFTMTAVGNTPVTANLASHVTGTFASTALARQPTKGTATLTANTVTYTASANATGSDSFTFTATNAGGTSAPATVTVTLT